MAVFQISRIQHRGGSSGELPDSLADREIGVTTDTGEVFMGAPNLPAIQSRQSYPYQNIKILTEFDVQRGIKGDVYHHGPLVGAVAPVGENISLVPLFPNGARDFGNLDWSLSSADNQIKAVGTLSFICVHNNRITSPVNVIVGANLNFGDTSWLTSAFGLTGASAAGPDDGQTWLRFSNRRGVPLLLAISGREWSIPPVSGFNN